MLLELVKLLKKEQFLLLSYHLLPAGVVTIYAQVTLHWIDSPPKHSSSNCMWPWDFHRKKRLVLHFAFVNIPTLLCLIIGGVE